MQPKNKFQKKIMGLSKKLSPITETQKVWAIKACTDKYAVISRKTTYCLECGYSWKEGVNMAHVMEHVQCPECRAKLKYKHHYAPNCKEANYFAILTTKKGMQVVRMFLISKFYKKKQNPTYSIREVMQHWITAEGKIDTLSIEVNNMSYEYDQWTYGELEPRTSTHRSEMRARISPWKIYPVRSILPILKRNGFSGYFYGFSPQELFRLLLSSNVAETLFKTKQFKLLESLRSSSERIEQYWKSIRVCIRHNYIIKSASTWFDYLQLLEYFGKDILNPHYICPENLSSEHDKLVLKKNKIVNEQKNREYQEQYEQEKAAFFDLEFKEDNISIAPLKTIEEFLEEAHAHKHCVYSNEYFRKSNSLVLSAKIDNQPIETVEISLKSLRIMQSRGRRNQATPYHDKIVNLVQRNLNQIEKIVAC